MCDKYSQTFYPQDSKGSCHRTLRALATEARKRGYYLQIFAPLSDLYQKTKDDAAQKRIYNFVDFNKICCLILFTEMIKDAPVKKELYMRAMSADVPTAMSLSVLFSMATALGSSTTILSL